MTTAVDALDKLGEPPNTNMVATRELGALTVHCLVPDRDAYRYRLMGIGGLVGIVVLGAAALYALDSVDCTYFFLLGPVLWKLWQWSQGTVPGDLRLEPDSLVMGERRVAWADVVSIEQCGAWVQVGTRAGQTVHVTGPKGEDPERDWLQSALALHWEHWKREDAGQDALQRHEVVQEVTRLKRGVEREG